jgi:hypothetical protein
MLAKDDDRCPVLAGLKVQDNQTKDTNDCVWHPGCGNGWNSSRLAKGA